MAINKRRHDRMKLEGIVFYSDAFLDEGSDSHVEKHKGRVVDISPSGICISSDHKLEPGSKVQFDIYELYKGTHVGVVKRCVRNNGVFHIGLEVPFGLKEVMNNQLNKQE
jgi:hypothetical protein